MPHPLPRGRVPVGSWDPQMVGSRGWENSRADVNQTRGHSCISWLDFGFSSFSFFKDFQL